MASNVTGWGRGQTESWNSGQGADGRELANQGPRQRGCGAGPPGEQDGKKTERVNDNVSADLASERKKRKNRGRTREVTKREKRGGLIDSTSEGHEDAIDQYFQGYRAGKSKASRGRCSRRALGIIQVL